MRALALKVPRVSSTLLIVYGSLWTPQGRQRLRVSLYTKVEPVLHAAAWGYRRAVARGTRVVAVTGTFGKTTTTRAVGAALGLPLTGITGHNSPAAHAAAVLRMRPWHRYMVFEVAASRPGQVARSVRVLRPNVAVVTCIGSEHLTSYGSLEVTRAEKAVAVRALPLSGTAILNGDDPNVLWMKDCTRARVITFGLDAANEVRAADVAPVGLSGTRFTVHVAGATREVYSRLVGRPMIYCMLAAIAVGHAEGLELDAVVSAIETLTSTQNRLQLISHKSGAVLLLDAYKGAVETIHAALDAVGELPARRKIVVLGDVEEPPASQGPIYREVGTHAARVADRVFFLGGKKNFARLRAGTAAAGLARQELFNIRGEPRHVAKILASELGPDDLVLIKGRSTEHLERIVLELTGRGVDCVLRLCRRRHDCATCPLRGRRSTTGSSALSPTAQQPTDEAPDDGRVVE
ncbi:MAG: Mur ligase family protein [Candidatus Bipolaricaulia bacterium]